MQLALLVHQLMPALRTKLPVLAGGVSLDGMGWLAILGFSSFLVLATTDFTY